MGESLLAPPRRCDILTRMANRYPRRPTAEDVERIKHLYANGHSLENVAAGVKVTRQTLVNWRKRSKELALEMDKIRVDRLDEVYNLARTGGRVTNYQWNWLLRNAKGEAYRDVDKQAEIEAEFNLDEMRKSILRVNDIRKKKESNDGKNETSGD